MVPPAKSSTSAPAPTSPLTDKPADESAGTPSSAGAAWLWPLTIAVAVALTFAPARQHELLFYDDSINIPDNPHLQRPLHLARVLHFWLHTYEGLYAPIPYTVFAAQVAVLEVAGLEPSEPLPPQIFHITSIALHALAAIAVWLWLRELTGMATAAGFGALLFALHPLAVESVGWVTDTRGLLAALFAALALWQYTVFAHRLNNERPAKAAYAWATAFFICGLLSKPSAASIPLMAAVVAVGWQKVSKRRVAISLVPWLIFAGILAIVTKSQQGAETLAFQVAWSQRPLVALDALSFSVGKLLVPVDLITDYGRSPDRIQEFARPGISMLVLVVLTLVSAISRARRIWLVALAVFVAGLTPTLGFITFSYQAHSTVADRFAYLALWGPALALAGALACWPQHALRGVAVVVIISLAVVSNAQIRYWQNDITLFQHTLTHNMRSLMAYNNLGIALFEHERYDEAIDTFRRGLEFSEDSFELHNGLGRALRASGEIEQALVAFHKAVVFAPGNLTVRNNLGETLLDARQPAAAAEQFLAVLEMGGQPYANVHFNLGSAYEALGQNQEALLCYRTALQLDPNYQEAAARCVAIEESANQTP